MAAAGPDIEERRAHPRVQTRFRVHCRRLARSGVDQDVDVVDLSMGGARITAPAELRVGDVVELTVEERLGNLTLTGLVVGVRTDDGARHGHIAFTRLVPAALERIGQLIDLTATS
jgi:hypothetical protein